MDLAEAAVLCGIPLYGVCEACIPPETVRRYKQWIDAGHQAGMKSLQETLPERIMERELLPGQKSAIVCGFPYPAFEPHPHISPYALFPDYHTIIKATLKKFKTALEKRFPGNVFLVCVDTLPVMEKVLAEQAGLGFQGRHTLLVNTIHGSRLFLGVILTTLSLKPSASCEPGQGCGGCRLCETACPTGALKDGQLDASCCLSYHTVENRGALPPFVSPKMDETAFGCGICEAVCPKNRKAVPGYYTDWRTIDEFRKLDLQKLLFMAETGFKRNFGHTPIARIGKAGFIRNIKLAMGNSTKKTYIHSMERPI